MMWKPEPKTPRSTRLWEARLWEARPRGEALFYNEALFCGLGVAARTRLLREQIQ
jgi:hypothetical protein